MIGIYVHNSIGVPYADDIVNGVKTVETRTRDVLGRFVGEPVAIVRTRDRHPADIIGIVAIVHKKFCTKEELDGMRDETCIPPGSKFDCNGKGKWCYFLTNPMKLTTPIPLSDVKIIKRNMSWCEFELKGE